ncbi:MAG TPA: hypothetical protein VIX60_07120 [Candidatus Cybelea sp.]
MIWSLAGLSAALVVGVTAFWRSRTPGGFHDRETYGMDASVHVRYAVVSLAFAAYFGATCATGLETAGIVGLALYALIAVFYATSFLQGAPDE